MEASKTHLHVANDSTPLPEQNFIRYYRTTCTSVSYGRTPLRVIRASLIGLVLSGLFEDELAYRMNI
jgi:hypothetical protein